MSADVGDPAYGDVGQATSADLARQGIVERAADLAASTIASAVGANVDVRLVGGIAATVAEQMSGRIAIRALTRHVLGQMGYTSLGHREWDLAHARV
jgi:hypothetical protein